MPAEKNLKIIHDVFLLYELSLAVGGSLDSQENCQRFIKVLISQKGLTYAAVWLRENTESPARLFCSAPERQLIQEEIGPDHFIWQQLDQKSFFSLRDTDTNFRELVQEDDIAGGAYSVFGLGELGFLKFFSAGRLSAFSKMEMSQLETVIHKFKVSLEGCLAHDRLMKESQRRLEMQKALKRSNERFVDLFENMNDALVIFDAEGNIIEANRAARKLALIDQLPGPNLWHLVPPEEVEKTKELYRSLLEKGENAGFEIRIVIPGGEEKYIQVNSSAIFENGKMVGSRNIIRDISERKAAEEVILNNQLRMRELIRNLQSGILLENEKREIAFVNQAFCDILNIDLPAEQLLGIDCSDSEERAKDWFEDPEGHVQDIKTLLRERKIRLNEEVRTIDGRILERDFIPLFSGDKFRGLLWQYRDLTDKRQTEIAIKNNEVRMQELIRNLQAGILLENEKREIVLINQFFCDIFGVPVPPSVLIGTDCSDSAGQSKGLFKDPEEFVRGIDILLKERKLAVGEELYMDDGRILERDFIPLYAGGQYLGHLWQYRETTEKRLAADAIRKSEEKYRGIIENMELGLLEVDAEERIVRAYDRFCDMTGYSSVELIGKNASKVLLPEDQRPIMEQQSADRREGKAGIYEIQIRKKDGTLIWVLISGAPLINAEGETVGSLGIHYDITKRKKMERELAEAKQQAEQARLAEQQFLANMSHEIRTPMNAVIGMTHLLYETPINTQQKEYLDTLRFSADTLLGIINNILDLSKIEAGELEIEEKPFNLFQLAQALQRTFQFRLKDKPVRVVLDYDDRIRPLVVADPTRLNQILTNLLGNASKFTRSGTVGLRVIYLAEDLDKYHLRFEVHDTGVGIPVDKVEMIFQNFKQVDVRVNREFGGTGLGLAIVKQLVELMKGDIKVESKQGIGSIFSVELSLKKSVAEVVERKWDHNVIGSEEKQFLSRLKVLVVEDNIMNQKLITSILETWGCRYVLAIDGHSALRKSTVQPFDLILMDVHMPGLDGCKTTRRIRADHSNPNRHSLIIALTAAALLDEKNRALDAGMDDYVTKPFSPAKLRDLVLQKINFEPSGEAPVENKILPDQSEHINIDLSYLFELSAGDLFFVRDMIEAFLRETPETLDQMRMQLQSKDWESLYRTVHSLKPNLMMLGMKSQEQFAAQAEEMLKSGSFDPERVDSLLKQIDTDTRTAFLQLNATLESL